MRILIAIKQEDRLQWKELKFYLSLLQLYFAP